jgi:hypothetical protein
MNGTLASKPTERALRKPYGNVPPLIKICESVIEGICRITNDADCMESIVTHLQHLRRLVSRLEGELLARARKTREAIPVLREAAEIAERLHRGDEA